MKFNLILLIILISKIFKNNNKDIKHNFESIETYVQESTVYVL